MRFQFSFCEPFFDFTGAAFVAFLSISRHVRPSHVTIGKYNYEFR